MQRATRRISWMAPAIVLALSIGTGARAADEPAAGQIDAKAAQVGHAMADYYKGLKSLTLTGAVEMGRQFQGQSQNITNEFEFALQRPNRFAMRPTGISSGRWGQIISDGDNLSIYIARYNKYTTEKSPADLDSVVNNRLVGMLSNQVGKIAGSLMCEDPYDRMFKNVVKAKYVGTEQMQGVECHHIRAEEAQVAWDAWIATGDKPQLVQVKPDMSEMEDKARRAGQDVKITLTIFFKDMKENPALADDTFAFKAPLGAEKVDSFYQSAEPKHPLVGKAASPFTLDQLTGAPINLADHKGKDIVILDFWATWCGPCVRAMPLVDEVAKAYKDRHVVLYAVNQQEGKDKIEAFLKKQNLDVTVLLDTKGEVGQLFKVSGIPQTVVIDKDGIVRAVHIGFSPELKETLEQDIDAILSGK